MTVPDKARLILHIGPHKTGTTFLQSLFTRNRDHLCAQGFAYPGDGINHNSLFLLFCDEPHKEHEMMRLGYTNPDSARSFVDRGLSDLHSNLFAADSKRILLSAEEFCRLSPVAIRRFLEFLAPFGPIHVIAFAREARALILSDAQEAIKDGFTFADLCNSPPTPNYSQTLGNWLKAVGHARMSVAVFPPAAPLEQVIAQMLAIAPFPDVDSAVRLNNSLSLNAAKILSALNAEHPPFLEDRANPARARVPLSWLAAVPGPSFRLSPEMTDRTNRLAEPEVRWLDDNFAIRFDDVAREAVLQTDRSAIDDDIAYALALLFNKLARQMNGFVAESLIAQAAHANERDEEALLRRAIAISPDSSVAYHRLARLLERDERQAEADNLLQHVRTP